jgi:C4-dicarboxylate-specific signal transduction histidine kinase
MPGFKENIQRDLNIRELPSIIQGRWAGDSQHPWLRHPSRPRVIPPAVATNSSDEITRAASAALAHELSQPLTAMACEIQAAIRWLDRPQPDVGKAIEGLRDLSRLTQHIGEVCVALQGMHSHGTGESFRNISMKPMLDSVLSSHQAEFEQLGICVHSSVPDTACTFGDEAQLRLVIRNLVANAVDAIRHLAPACRRISLEVTEMAKQTVIVVEDSGPGVSEAHQPYIFEAFFTTKHKGMGVGLMICEGILARHGGSLWNLRGRGGESMFVAILGGGIG